MSQTITAPVHYELVIKKSRFLARVQPMADRAKAQQVLAQLRRASDGGACLLGPADGWGTVALPHQLIEYLTSRQESGPDALGRL